MSLASSPAQGEWYRLEQWVNWRAWSYMSWASVGSAWPNATTAMPAVKSMYFLLSGEIGMGGTCFRGPRGRSLDRGQRREEGERRL